MDPVVSKTIVGGLKSGWRDDNRKTLVPQVIHHATSDRQRTDKHRKFPEITGASHGSEDHIHHIGEAKRNHQEEELSEQNVDTSNADRHRDTQIVQLVFSICTDRISSLYSASSGNSPFFFMLNRQLSSTLCSNYILSMNLTKC